MYSAYTQRVAVSQRGFDFVAAHFACEQDRFAVENPGGFVNLGSAQNYLAKPELEQQLDAIRHSVSDAEYHPFDGTDRCKVAIATYLESHCREPINPDQIVVGNGLISLLEALAIATLDAGDRVLVPAPVFPGLVKALTLRTGAEALLVETRAEDCFRVTPEFLERATEESRRCGRPIKAILLCSPGNPVGHVYSHTELRELIRVGESANAAVIVDEVYAQSCFEGVRFESAIDFSSHHVFVLGGLSKDFGVAGYSVGWLHGLNERIMRAVASQAHFFRLATPAQRAAEHLLSSDFCRVYLPAHRHNITAQFQLAKDGLRGCGVELLHADAGLCAVLDLRSFLNSHDEAGELQLYRHLLERHRVHLSPGLGFHWSQSGLFRICVTVDVTTLRAGLQRIREGLESFTGHSATPLENLSTTCSNASETHLCPLPTPANSSLINNMSKTSSSSLSE